MLWEGFPPELATWEEEDEDVPCGEVDFIARYEAEMAEAAEGADESDERSHSQTRMQRNKRVFPIDIMVS